MRLIMTLAETPIPVPTFVPLLSPLEDCVDIREVVTDADVVPVLVGGLEWVELVDVVIEVLALALDCGCFRLGPRC